ncbi:MAG: hypothetical protein QGG50_06025 [Methanopyri archaeon]|jgi:DNA-binding transcriptional regulator GbsR (MarR family)|nr:hypothetical protein [Methanopyri archaeon]
MELSEADRSFVALITRIGQAIGYPGDGATVYGILFAADEPLSQEDLAELTGFSVPKVSKILSGMGDFVDVERIKVPGDRRGYYVCRHALTDLMTPIHFRTIPTINIAIVHLREVRDTYDRDGDNRMCGHIDELIDKAVALLAVLERMSRQDPREILRTIEAGEKTLSNEN